MTYYPLCNKELEAKIDALMSKQGFKKKKDGPKILFMSDDWLTYNSDNAQFRKLTVRMAYGQKYLFNGEGNVLIKVKDIADAEKAMANEVYLSWFDLFDIPDIEEIALSNMRQTMSDDEIIELFSEVED